MKYILALILIMTLRMVFGQEEPINEQWVKMDSIYISKIKDKIKIDSTSIIPFLNPQKRNNNNLGSGFIFNQSSNGKGYVSIFYEIISKNNKTISYCLTPEMPTKDNLYASYRKFYTGLFSFKDNKPKQLIYNYKAMTESIDSNHCDLTSEELFYMTPFSGIVYGEVGGIVSTILENRGYFNSLPHSVNDKNILCFLSSINPATRLTVIEYYYQHKSLFKSSAKIEDRIVVILKQNIPTYTMKGCIMFKENPKVLLNQYIK